MFLGKKEKEKEKERERGAVLRALALKNANAISKAFLAFHS